MLSVFPPLFLILVILQNVPEAAPPLMDDCEDTKRLDVSLPPTPAWEVCIRPGVMTGFVFDAPVVVELQDEGRFREVARGRNSVSLIPPQDMEPGERFRITARLSAGAIQQSVTFALVAHDSQATRQIDVYHDKRTWQALHDEAIEERIQNKRLIKRNQYLQTELDGTKAKLSQSQGLRGAHTSRLLEPLGLLRRGFPKPIAPHPGHIYTIGIATFRSKQSVGVEVLLYNDTTEPWVMTGGALFTDMGESIGDVQFLQPDIIQPSTQNVVFVELSTTRITVQGITTLKVWDANSTTVTVPEVIFP